jgi:hypothetical protein
MRTALYFDENDAQLALTPESEWEKAILRMIRERMPDISYEGSFYAYQGGWVRQHLPSSSSSPFGDRDFTGNALMIRLPRKGPTP